MSLSEQQFKALDNIRIVLVNTSHPGNIGAAARVMKNMGLSQLYLVQPKTFPHADATSMAAGADDLLHQAICCDNLAQALNGCQLVLGTTARTRKIRHQILEPREASQKAVNLALKHKVAFVFGRERTGLTNLEVDQCEVLINIPSSETFSSLNLASAVQILSYEVRLASRETNTPQVNQLSLNQPSQSSEPEHASHDDLEGMFTHLEQTLLAIDFLNPEKSPQIMSKLKHLYHRAQLHKNEVNILRGILSATHKNQD